MQINTPSLEEYPDLSLDDILAMFVDEKHRDHDRALFATKWWDYRMMTPTEATLAYIDAFGVEVRKIYARDIDYERAQHIHVVTGASVRKGLLENEQKAKRAFAGFWRGRQVADALGMPYDVYTAEVLNSRMRYWANVKVQDRKGKWRTKLPTATQLYGERDVERVQARWEELQASRVFYSEHHAFLPQNYVGAPVQDAYFAYLAERAGRSSNRIAMLADMVEHDRLPVEYLHQHVEQGICEKVLDPQR